MPYRNLFLFLLIFSLLILIQCGMFEPEKTTGSLVVNVSKEGGGGTLCKATALSKVHCIVKKGSSSVYDEIISKVDGLFNTEIDDLKPSDDYSILIYGKNSSNEIISRAYKSDVEVTVGDVARVNMSWGSFQPVLVSPVNGIAIAGNIPVFNWNNVSSASEYELQVDNTDNFSSPNINQNNLTSSGYTVTSALSDGTWYWRVRVKDSQENWGGWSGTWNFIISTLNLDVSTSILTLSADANSQGSFTVTSNTNWTITDDASWLTVSPSNSSNNGTVTVTATSSNTSPNPRTAIVTVSGTGVSSKTVTVTQNGIALNLSVSTTSLSLIATSNSQSSFSVTSNTSWGVSDNVSWLTVSPASGANNGNVTVTATSGNTSSSSRTATVTVSGSGVDPKSITVTQLGTAPSLSVSTNSLSLSADANSHSSFDIASNISWSVSDDATWLTVSPSSGSNNGTVTVTATSSNTSPNPRTAIVTVSGTGVSSKTVTVTQNGIALNLAVSTTSLSLSATSNSQSSFTVTSNTSWNVSDDASWLTASPASGANNGTVTVTATSNNTSPNPRTAIVTISGTGVSSKTVTVTQNGIALNLSVSTTSLSLSATSNSQSSFEVTSNTSWSVNDDASWLTVSPSSGSNNGTVTVTATSVNTSINSRTAEITVSSTGVDSKTVNVIQEGIGHKLTLVSTTINSNTISGQAPEFTVSVGESISGSFDVLFEHSMPESHALPLAVTPNWGDKKNDYWQAKADMYNNQTYAESFSITAPSTPGTYYLIIANSSNYTAGQILSGTHWGYGSLVWDDGNDIFDLDVDQLEEARQDGYIMIDWLTSDGSYKERDIGITAIKLNIVQGVVVGSLVAYYPFNNNANDESWNGNDGTLHGPILTQDRFSNENSAYFFDGVDDYIDIGNQVKPQFPISVSMWVKPDEMKAGLVFRNDIVDGNSWYRGIAVIITSDGKLQGWVGNGYASPSSRKHKTTDIPVINTNRWQFMTLIFNDYNDINIYYNNVEYSGVYEGSGTGMSYSSNSGAIGFRGSGIQFYHGGIDDIRIYNYALNETEIQELYYERGWTGEEENVEHEDNTLIYEDGFESDLSSFQVSNRGSCPYEISNEYVYEGNTSLKVGPSTCGASAFDSYSVTLVKRFDQPVLDLFIEFWVYEEGNWGGRIGVFIENDDPRAGTIDKQYLFLESPRGNNEAAQPGWVKMTGQYKGEVSELSIYFYDMTSSDALFLDNLKIYENPNLVNKNNIAITSSSNRINTLPIDVYDNLGNSWGSVEGEEENSWLEFSFQAPQQFKYIGIKTYLGCDLTVLDESENSIASYHIDYICKGVKPLSIIELPSYISPGSIKLKFNNVDNSYMIVEEVWFMK